MILSSFLILINYFELFIRINYYYNKKISIKVHSFPGRIIRLKINNPIYKFLFKLMLHDAFRSMNEVLNRIMNLWHPTPNVSFSFYFSHPLYITFQIQ